MSEDIERERGLLERTGSFIAGLFSGGYLGGELKAAFYQGTGEIAAALKAFPDSIQVNEPGQAFNPLYRDRDGDTPAHVWGGPSPSEIARDAQGSVYGPKQPTRDNVLAPSDLGREASVYGQGPQAGQQPSEIAHEAQTQGPEQQQSHEREHGRGR